MEYLRTKRQRGKMLDVRTLIDNLRVRLSTVNVESFATDSTVTLRLVFKRVIFQAGQLAKFLRKRDSNIYSSVVIEYIVPRHRGWAFRRWHGGFIQKTKQSEGFLRADRYRPLQCQDGTLKWYSVIHFDQPNHLDQWLSSDQRISAFESGRSIFSAYKFKSFSTGLEGWFSDQSRVELDNLGPSAWKQIISVVLGIYPIIMLQDYLFGSLDILDSWTPASAMLAKNIFTTCILTLVVMPLIVRTLDFWLQPAHQKPSIRAEIAGTAFTIVTIGLMVFIFNEII